MPEIGRSGGSVDRADENETSSRRKLFVSEVRPIEVSASSVRVTRLPACLGPSTRTHVWTVHYVMYGMLYLLIHSISQFSHICFL